MTAQVRNQPLEFESRLLNRLTRILQRNWFLVVLQGVLSLLAAVFILAFPGVSLSAMVVVFGVYAIADGVALIAGSLTDSRSRGWSVFSGLVSIAIGGLTLVTPGLTALALLYVIASWAIVGGGARIIEAIDYREEIADEWPLALAGAASIVLGLVMIAAPGAGILAVLGTIAAFRIFTGFALIAVGLHIRSLPYAGR